LRPAHHVRQCGKSSIGTRICATERNCPSNGTRCKSRTRCAATDYRECASSSRWRSLEPPPSFLADQTTDRTLARRHASRNVHHDRCQRAFVLLDSLAGSRPAVWSRPNFSGFSTRVVESIATMPWVKAPAAINDLPLGARRDYNEFIT